MVLKASGTFKLDLLVLIVWQITFIFLPQKCDFSLYVQDFDLFVGSGRPFTCTWLERKVRWSFVSMVVATQGKFPNLRPPANRILPFSWTEKDNNLDIKVCVAIRRTLAFPESCTYPLLTA